MAEQDQQQEQPAVPSIADYGRVLSSGYSHDEIKDSIAKESGLSGPDLDAEYLKLQAATTIQPEPGTMPAPKGDTSGIPAPPDPVPGSYNPEDEQAVLRRAQSIEDPRVRLKTEQYIKQEYANRRIMDGVTQATREKNLKTAMGQYSKAVEEIRDDPRASLEKKHGLIKMLTQTMWNDPRTQYGETQGQLEDYMQKLAFGEDAEKLGDKYSTAVHGVVTGQIKTPQQLLEMYDRGDLTWSGLQKSFGIFEKKDKPDQAAIHQRIDFANQQIKNAYLKGLDENGVYGEKPSPRVYDKMTAAYQALNTLILAAGDDHERVAKLTSHEAVAELYERVYPLYERNADRVLGGAKAFAAIQVPQTVSADERSQIAYRDIAGIPPTMTNADGKPVQVSPAKWAEGIEILRRTGQVENFNKAFDVDSGAYILKTLPYRETPIAATPISLVRPEAPAPAPELARTTTGAGPETPAAVREAAGKLGKWLNEHRGHYQPAAGANEPAWNSIMAALRDLEHGVPAPGVTP